MTGPTVLSGRATSILWFGLRGVSTCSGPAGARPKLQTHTEEGASVNMMCGNIWRSQQPLSCAVVLPVSVKLDGEISHDAHSFISEGHLHLNDTRTASESARYLQSLGLHGRKPNLKRQDRLFSLRSHCWCYITLLHVQAYHHSLFWGGCRLP